MSEQIKVIAAGGIPAASWIAPEKVQIRKWLADMATQNKTAAIFELEMWIRCFDRFFRIRNHPFTETEFREVVRRDFSEELKIVRSVSLRMSQLCSDILTHERTDSDYFLQYVENELLHKDGTMRLENRPTRSLSPEDSLSLLIESLTDLRPILESITQLPVVNFQTFTAVGKLVSRELVRCHHIRPLLSDKFKPEFDRISHAELTTIIREIPVAELRQEVAQIFLECFRLLRYLQFIGEDLRADRPLKRSLLIFSLIHSEIRTLLDNIENHLLASSFLEEDRRDAIDGCSYAMRMEMDKVFGRELVGFVSLRQAPPIYAKVENSHGLLRNCLQQTLVGIAQAFNTKLTGTALFPDFQTFQEQSRKLRNDVWRLISYLRFYESHVSYAHDGRLIDELVSFRDGSMKYLMFRDWEHLERLHDDLVSATSEDELKRAIHLFATYLEALLGQVNMRAVLAREPFDYPEVKIEVEPAVAAA